jgi:hypothetical protein
MASANLDLVPSTYADCERAAAERLAQERGG